MLRSANFWVKFCLAIPIFCCSQVFAQSINSFTAPNPQTTKKNIQDVRPTLIRKQGNTFSFSIPPDWRYVENTNGLELISPDNLTGVAGSFVFGMFGQQTPEGFFRMVLSTLPYADVKILSQDRIPEVPGPFGLYWRGIEIEFSAIYKGTPSNIRVISQVLQGSGQYSAILTSMQGPTAQWNDLRLWLPHVRDRIAITNPAPAYQSLANGLPKGIRHDEIYGAYNKAWHARGVSEAALSQARREATMGYTSQMDPTTGQTFDLPLGAYDPTKGGYTNPHNKNQLLVPAR